MEYKGGVGLATCQVYQECPMRLKASRIFVNLGKLFRA
jgi:hypothetical protein